MPCFVPRFSVYRGSHKYVPIAASCGAANGFGERLSASGTACAPPAHSNPLAPTKVQKPSANHFKQLHSRLLRNQGPFFVGWGLFGPTNGQERGQEKGQAQKDHHSNAPKSA